MNNMDASIKIEIEDICTYAFKNLKLEGLRHFSHYGYDIYVRNLANKYLKNELNISDRDIDNYIKNYSPIFLNALWEICKRGIVRPGVTHYQAQAVDEGGYSITPYGEKWINNWNEENYIPLSFERYCKLLVPFSQKFGKGFYQRAQEAVKCYHNQTYLACCSMAGAATESILLELGSKKLGDDEVIKTYFSISGRKNLANKITNNLKDYYKNNFLAFKELLHYWRDESSHGRYSEIGDDEAYIALSKLYRFSKFVDANWETITT